MIIFSLGKAAAYLGKHPQTLQRWDRDGTLRAGRLPSGRRVYTQAQLDACITEENPESPPKDLLARVEELEKKMAALEGKK